MEVCPLHEGMVERLQRCENDIKTLQNQDNEINIRQARMETKLDYMTAEVKAMIVKIDTIINQPAKRWDSVTNALIVAAIVGLATAFFMKG